MTVPRWKIIVTITREIVILIVVLLILFKVSLWVGLLIAVLNVMRSLYPIVSEIKKEKKKKLEGANKQKTK